MLRKHIRLPWLVYGLVLVTALGLAPAVQSQSEQAPGQMTAIEYQMAVQRAAEAAIWAMPAVGMIDFEKATKRDLGGDVNQVVYVSKPFASRHGFLTANDVSPMPGHRSVLRRVHSWWKSHRRTTRWAISGPSSMPGTSP
jgi:hypothetical protein